MKEAMKSTGCYVSNLQKLQTKGEGKSGLVSEVLVGRIAKIKWQCRRNRISSTLKCPSHPAHPPPTLTTSTLFGIPLYCHFYTRAPQKPPTATQRLNGCYCCPCHSANTWDFLFPPKKYKLNLLVLSKFALPLEISFADGRHGRNEERHKKEHYNLQWPEYD